MMNNSAMLIVVMVVLCTGTFCVAQPAAGFLADHRRRFIHNDLLWVYGLKQENACATHALGPKFADVFLCGKLSQTFKAMKRESFECDADFLEKRLTNVCYDEACSRHTHPEKLSTTYGYLEYALRRCPKARPFVGAMYVTGWNGSVRDLDYTIAMMNAEKARQVVERNNGRVLLEALPKQLAEYSEEEPIAAFVDQLKAVLQNHNLSHSTKMAQAFDWFDALLLRSPQYHPDVLISPIEDHLNLASFLKTAAMYKYMDTLRFALSGAPKDCALIRALQAFSAANCKSSTKMVKAERVTKLIDSLTHAFQAHKNINDRAKLAVDELHNFVTENRQAESALLQLEIPGYGTVHNLMTATAFKFTTTVI